MNDVANFPQFFVSFHSNFFYTVLHLKNALTQLLHRFRFHTRVQSALSLLANLTIMLVWKGTPPSTVNASPCSSCRQTPPFSSIAIHHELHVCCTSSSPITSSTNSTRANLFVCDNFTNCGTPPLKARSKFMSIGIKNELNEWSKCSWSNFIMGAWYKGEESGRRHSGSSTKTRHTSNAVTRGKWSLCAYK